MTLEERTVRLALHYLGAREGDENAVAIVQKAYALCLENAKPQTVCRTLTIASLCPAVTFCDSDVAFCSKALSKHLNGATEALLVAHTLGSEVDMLQEKLNHSDVSFAVTFNAVCSAYAEVKADADLLEKAQAVLPENSRINARFCAGYADFDAKCNRDLLNLISPRGGLIAVQESGALLPRKSIVGVCGVFETDDGNLKEM